MGEREPRVDSYIVVDIARNNVYQLLRTVESLFARCGGAQEAFTATILQSTLAPACASLPLESHHVDTLSEQFRNTEFVSYDGAPNALRVFDFIKLLTKVGSIAFPGDEP